MSRNRELFKAWDPKTAIAMRERERRARWEREAAGLPAYEYDAEDVAALVQEAREHLHGLGRVRGAWVAMGRAAIRDMIEALANTSGAYWRQNLAEFRVYYHTVLAWVLRREARAKAERERQDGGGTGAH